MLQIKNLFIFQIRKYFDFSCEFKRVNNRRACKTFPLQKSICLLTGLSNHPENNSNTSWHQSILHTIAPIIFINLITRNFITKVYGLFIFLFYCDSANGDLEMTSRRVTSHLMTPRFGVNSLLRLCECLFNKHANFQQVTFHDSWDIWQLYVIFNWASYNVHFHQR